MSDESQDSLELNSKAQALLPSAPAPAGLTEPQGSHVLELRPTPSSTPISMATPLAPTATNTTTTILSSASAAGLAVSTLEQTPPQAQMQSQTQTAITGEFSSLSLRLNGTPNRQQIVELSDKAQTIDEVEPEKCQLVYEDCKYSVLLKLVLNQNASIKHIGCLCNNFSLGHVDFEPLKQVVVPTDNLTQNHHEQPPLSSGASDTKGLLETTGEANALVNSPANLPDNLPAIRYETQGWLKYAKSGNAQSSFMGFPFSMLCEMARFTFVITFKDDSKLELYSPYLLCANKNPDDSDNIKQMLSKLADFDNSVIGGWLFPEVANVSSNQRDNIIHHDITHPSEGEDELNPDKVNTHRSFKSYLQLLEEIITCYQNNLAYFSRMGKHSIRKETVLQSPLNVKSLTVAGFQWLMQNSDQLSPVNSNKGIYYRGQNYVPLQMASEVNIKSSDVYENQVVVSFLNIVLNNAKRIGADLKDSVTQNTTQVSTLEQAQNATLNSLTAPITTFAKADTASAANTDGITVGLAAGLAESKMDGKTNGEAETLDSTATGATSNNVPPGTSNTEVPDHLERYDSNIARLKKLQLGLSQELLHKLDSTIETLNNLLGQYLNMFKIKPSLTLNMPRKTKTFQEIKPYTQVFAMFLKWLNYGEFKLEKDKLLLKVKTLDQLFEYYCLIGLLEMLQANGYTLSTGVTLNVIQPQPTKLGLTAPETLAALPQAQAQSGDQASTTVQAQFKSQNLSQSQTLTEKLSQLPEQAPTPVQPQMPAKVIDDNFNLLARSSQITSYAISLNQEKELLELNAGSLVSQDTHTLDHEQTELSQANALFNMAEPSSKAKQPDQANQPHQKDQTNQDNQSKLPDQTGQTLTQPATQTGQSAKTAPAQDAVQHDPFKTYALHVGPIYTFRYQVANGGLFKANEHIPNTFVLRKGNVEVTLYYQPIISSTEFQNRLSLYRTTNPNAVGDFYSPDFVLKFARKLPATATQATAAENNASPLQLKLQAQTQANSALESSKIESTRIEENYVILDSKFATRKNINEHYLEDVISKYSTQVAVNQECSSPKMVWILQGRVDSREEPIWRLHSSPLARLYKPTTSIGIMTVNASMDNRQLFWQEIQEQIPWI